MDTVINNTAPHGALTPKDITGFRTGKAVAYDKKDGKRKNATLRNRQRDRVKEILTETTDISSGAEQGSVRQNKKRIKDITGQKYGKLTAVKRLDEKSGTSYMWLCRCDCGNEVKVSISNLTSGQVKSCGCMKKESAKINISDIRGQRFGKLTVIEPTEKRADGGCVVWKCHCDCGNDAEVSLSRLKKGKVRSCGCLSNPPFKDYTGMRFGRLTVLNYAGKLNPSSCEHYWTCRCDCGNETNVGQNELKGGDTVSCGCYQREKLIDSLKLFENTSVSILERNKKLRASNKSGYTGVFQEKSGKWIAYINFKKKRYWLGRFDEKADAIRAREQGEKMHDDFLEWYYTEYGHSAV